jgi:hypothetical protein
MTGQGVSTASSRFEGERERLMLAAGLTLLTVHRSGETPFRTTSSACIARASRPSTGNLRNHYLEE